MSQFGHETLNAYQESIRFITWISELLETIPNQDQDQDRDQDS
jgi:hypothetical protein